MFERNDTDSGSHPAFTISANEPLTASRCSDRSIVVPTWSGHKDDATVLIQSIRAHQVAPIDIHLVISEDERELFAPLVNTFKLSVLTIEELVKDYTGKDISGPQLLKMVDRYRFQTLKKYLAVAQLEGLVLLLDSESRITRDLAPIFDGGLPETTVLYSLRPWDRMPSGLAKDVYEECCYLLGRQPFWYFESLNWLYSTDIVRDLLAHLKSKHGTRWVFRKRQLFESQLYFQFAHERGEPYRFMQAEQLLAEHFGHDRAAQILASIFKSPWKAAGIFEFLARFVTRAELAGFISDESMLRHFRLLRYEPYGFYDVVGQLRQHAQCSPHYFGEAAMHRGPFVHGRTAVLLFGDLLVEEDIYNVQGFLAGVECDVFLALPRNNWLASLAVDVLEPVCVIECDVEPELETPRTLWRVSRKAATKDRFELSGAILGDLIVDAFAALVARERNTHTRYAAIVGMRPQVCASRHLRDVLWDASENVSGLADKVLVPNRMWRDGVNADLFFGLRAPAGKFLQSLSRRVCDEDGTLERALGAALLASEVKPVPFPFQYFLAEDGYPDLRHVTRRFQADARQAWTGKITEIPWKDASASLAFRMKQQLKPPRINLLAVWSRVVKRPLRPLEMLIRRTLRERRSRAKRLRGSTA